MSQRQGGYVSSADKLRAGIRKRSAEDDFDAATAAVAAAPPPQSPDLNPFGPDSPEPEGNPFGSSSEDEHADDGANPFGPFSDDDEGSATEKVSSLLILFLFFPTPHILRSH